MDSLQQDPYGHDAAEAHYRHKADRDRRRREASRRQQQQQSTFLTAPPAYQPGPSITAPMQASSMSAAQAATRRVAEVEQPPRTRDDRSRREQAPSQSSSSRRHHSPQTRPQPPATYSPFPPTAPVQRRPVANQSDSRPRNESPSQARPGSADSVLSFVSTTSQARPSRTVAAANPPSPQQSTISARRKPVFPPLPPARPTSSGSSFLKKLSFSGKSPARNGSVSSNNSQASNQSRPYTPSRIRRASNDIAKNLTLLTLPASSRTTYLSEKSAAREEDLEKDRTANPNLRPRFQRDFLEWRARKEGIWDDDKGVQDLVGMSMTAEERRLAVQAALQGRGSGGDVRWSAEEEVDRLKKSGHLPGQKEASSTGGGHTASEEIAMFLARGLDPLRKKDGGRKDSKSISPYRFHSDLPFEEWDQEDGEDDLPSNYGDRKDSHPFSISSFSASSSSGSELELQPPQVNILRDPAVVAKAYVKLSKTRKIGRLRDTVYSDPGNPFDGESDIDEVDFGVAGVGREITPAEQKESSAKDETPPPPLDFWRESWPSQSRLSKRRGVLQINTKEKRSHEDGKKVGQFKRRSAASSSSSSDDYDDAGPPPGFWRGQSSVKVRKRPETQTRQEVEESRGRKRGPRDGAETVILAPAPKRSGTPALIREHSLPLFPEDKKEMGNRNAKEDDENRDTRDTRFYKFYSGVLGEYTVQTPR
ncbi:hypothetical protein TI39_contig4197g00008 [Zymoseptoria brevis]|uniref:Uncharacterized protein n=1 Tax=Zymoseptoria brevis TaxID=1047168 RepID=A0A0F4GAI3_9PEZI|nr:hypothetical protein TI39_contig4197g00008 [Zymoseptoria brevis]